MKLDIDLGLLCKAIFLTVIIAIVTVYIVYTVTGMIDSQSANPFDAIQLEREKSYYEGQKDYINGDIRIKDNGDGCFVWVKSPWDSHKKPQFKPCDF